MGEKLIYELPKEKEEVMEIVRAIPSNWCWVDGFLAAPKELYVNGKIAENTRLFLSRFNSINPLLIGASDVPYEDSHLDSVRWREPGKVPPNIIDVLLKGKLVSSVSFDEAAFENREITINTVKEIAEGFIKMGYMGWISAYSGYRNNHKVDNPERFYFTHSLRNRHIILGQALPPHISLEWNEQYGGERKNLDGLLETMERLRLKELQVQEAK